MEATILKEYKMDDITTVVLKHPVSGYQIQVTPARIGFVIHSSQGVEFRQYDFLSYEVEPERKNDD